MLQSFKDMIQFAEPASTCHVGGREFNSGRTNTHKTQGLKITE